MSEPISIVDPLIGKPIGRYVFIDKIGEGGMGAVYRAQHPHLGTMKVIKTTLPLYAGNEEIRDRFEREAKAIAALHHDHIVAVDDYGQLEDGRMFLMMPYLQGETLESLIGRFKENKEKINTRFALHIIAQVCDALQHMHDAGLVHRDVKPANIFLTFKENNYYFVTLIDLGIAKSLHLDERVTSAGVGMGTPGYMAVEQHDDARGATSSADIYAAAITMWEMLSGGSLPWAANTPQEFYQLKKHVTPTRPIDIPEPMFAVLLRALSPNPADRHPSARAFTNALADAVEPIPYAPTGPQIVGYVASHFLENVPPTEETLRKPEGASVVATSWLPRPEAPAARSSAVAQRPVAQTPVRTAVLQPMPEQRTTTLSSAAGPAAAPPASHSRRRSLLIASGLVVASASILGPLALSLRGETGEAGVAAVPSAVTSPRAADAASAEGSAVLSTSVPPSKVDAMPADATYVDGAAAVDVIGVDGGVTDAPHPPRSIAPTSRPRPTSPAPQKRLNPDAIDEDG